MAFFAVASYAQNRLITGSLSDRDTKDPLTQTTVQLLRAKDSTFVAGTISNNEGKFSVKANDDGRYIVRITSIGYKPVIKRVNITNSGNIDLGKIILGSDAVMLKGATVVGQAAKVTLKEDTFVYKLLSNQYYIPKFYEVCISKPYYAISVWVWKVNEIKLIDASIDGLAHFINKLSVKARPIQSGNLSSSLRLMSLGLILGLVFALVLSVL